MSETVRRIVLYVAFWAIFATTAVCAGLVFGVIAHMVARTTPMGHEWSSMAVFSAMVWAVMSYVSWWVFGKRRP